MGLTQGIDSAVYHQGFDPEVYAATVLGTFAGTMAAKPLDARLTAYNENKAYQQQEAQEQKAYAAKAAEALKANEDQYLRKRGYIGYTSAADDYLDDQAQQIMNGSNANADAVPRASQNSASMFSRKPVQTSTPRSQSYDARQQRHQDLEARATINSEYCEIDWNFAGVKGFIGPNPEFKALKNGSSAKMLNQFGIFNDSKVESKESSSVIEWVHTGLGAAAVVTGIGEYSNKIGDYWRGANGKWYESAWGGNQYTGSRNMVFERAERFGKLGRVGLGIDIGLELFESIGDIKERNYGAATKAGLDITMGVVGEFGGFIGFVASTAYYAIDATVRWENAFKEMEKVDEVNERVTGRSMWAGPKI